MKKLFEKLSPNAKKWLIRSAILFGVVILAIPAYRSKTIQNQIRGRGKFNVLDYDPKTFEKSLLETTKAEVNQLRKEIEDLRKEMKKNRSVGDNTAGQAGDRAYPQSARQKAIPPAAPSPGYVNVGQSGLAALSANDMSRLKRSVEERVRDLKGTHKKDAVVREKLFPRATTTRPRMKTANQKKPSFGIRTVRSDRPLLKKKSAKTIYLPPSFMDASLLSGVVAPATEAGRSHPIPMLIRVRDLAVLPNEVKQDLKGCFIIAEGSGDLAQERVETRLLTLSCISNDGNAVIDQTVKGWVVDADGRAGLSGRVVAKFGSHIARVAIAGFMEGFGKAFESSVLKKTTNLLGLQQSELRDSTTETILKAGAGRGVVEVAQELSDFYLELAQQSMPVIEVGPTKTITLIISEGVELEIKERKRT